MPLKSLSYGAKQCAAKSKRSKERCKNPAAFGTASCRMHGAVAYEKRPRGKSHGRYMHGKRTLEAQLEQSATSRTLQQIEDAMHLLGMTTAKRSRGRKANGYYKITSLDKIKKTLKSRLRKP